ncbi:MAG: DUF3990 domain-containing protein [Lachnospiraceae bacterium]|nr:DUF3990 domain-containing protein [Lachnospiraceae bacterium]
MYLFHGSNVCVETPQILTNGHYKDFGFGFYCTNYEHQAKKWALTRRGKLYFVRKRHSAHCDMKGVIRYD